MVTIRDVAKLAGVSAGTVSRALAGSDLVNENTKQQVLEAAKTLNYLPNQFARGLKGGYSKVIGVIVPTIINPFFSRTVMELQYALAEKGYVMMLGMSDDNPETELHWFEKARTFWADGMILLPCHDNPAYLKRLESFQMPVVLMNRGWDKGIACVSNDDYEGAYRMVEHLVQKGHRHFACVQRNLNATHFQSRYDGFQKAFHDYNIPPEQVEYIAGDSILEAYENTYALYQRGSKTTAFVSMSDWIIPGIYSAIVKSGRSIPQDVSVVGCDNTDEAQYMIPPLSSWCQPFKELAHMATDMLIEEIEQGKKTQPDHYIINGYFKERGSVGQAPVKK